MSPLVDDDWSVAYPCHPAVAAAIHAVSSATRPAMAIWEAPFDEEREAVAATVAEYIAAGAFPATEDGRYAWGHGVVVID